MAKRKGMPSAKLIDQAAAIIRNRLVNRRDRWGTYWVKDGKAENITEPTRAKVREAKRVGKNPPVLDASKIKTHIRQAFFPVRGMPLGVHAISTNNHSKWLAMDIDRHDDRIPPSVAGEVAKAIFRFVKDNLGLRCVVESSGGGGWHIWIPLSEEVPSPDAHMVAYRIRAIGRRAWPTEHGKPRIDAYPNAPVHDGPTHAKGCGGGWLRLPGRHQRLREHVSKVLVGRRRFAGLDVWALFEKVARINTPDKWRTALTEAADVPPERRECGPTKTAGATTRRTSGRAPAKEAECAKPEFDYGGMTVDELATTPLAQEERREREQALISAVVGGNGSLEDAEQAVWTLYEEATGESRDLNDPAMRQRLFEAIPDLVLRLSGSRSYCWASRDEAERIRNLYLAAAQRRQQNRRRRGLRADIVEHFTEWLDALYGKLRCRARDGGHYFLANTILTTMPLDGCDPGPDAFHLRDHGGGTRIRRGMRVIGRDRTRAVEYRMMTDKFKVFLEILCRTPIDGERLVRVVRPAIRLNRAKTKSLILDCSRLPLDRGDRA